MIWFQALPWRGDVLQTVFLEQKPFLKLNTKQLECVELPGHHVPERPGGGFLINLF